jgi:predicted Zn-dependent protease
MRSRSAVVPLLAALSLPGCEGAVAPERRAAYEFDLYGTGLVFHWTPDRLPVRYWVAPDAGVVREFVTTGIARWTDQFLWGEFRGILVEDSAAADVLVRVSPPDPPAGNPTDDPPVVGACAGVTSNDVTLESPRTLTGSFRLTVSWSGGYPDADIVNCLERVTIHEIGHTIGLFGHSPNDFDLMNPTPRVASPSLGDRVTAEVLYRTPASILPPVLPR